MTKEEQRPRLVMASAECGWDPETAVAGKEHGQPILRRSPALT
jgi:hypothetical protein